MVRPDRDKLSGTIEMDETFVGGKRHGKAGRGAKGKNLVGIAVEDKKEKGIGRIRLQLLQDASSKSLISFVSIFVEPQTTIRTDDWPGYRALQKNGFKHLVVNSYDLKLVDLVASLVKRWLLGTYQGAVRPSHLQYYLDEFTFRFNRRKSRSRGKLFYRLVQQSLMIKPVVNIQLRAKE